MSDAGIKVPCCTDREVVRITLYIHQHFVVRNNRDVDAYDARGEAVLTIVTMFTDLSARLQSIKYDAQTWGTKLRQKLVANVRTFLASSRFINRQSIGTAEVMHITVHRIKRNPLPVL